MLIDDLWVDAAGQARDVVRNPANQDIIDHVPRGTEVDVAKAVDAAQRGKRAMARLPAHERCAALMRVADAIEADHDALARLLARENGKTLRETTSEVAAAIRIWRGYAEEAKRIFGRAMPLDSVPGLERSLAMTLRHPRGVVAAIVPFNYPVELWSHKAAGALAAGNAVITKPPEECPLSIIRIAEFIQQAGLPPAAHQLVTGQGDVVGDALVRSAGVNMVAMTGSTAAGQAILKSAANSLKKVHLELGGNYATIVCADADPLRVAADLISGRFTSGNGQICCAVKRVMVARDIHEDLVDSLVEMTRFLKLGDPLDGDTDVGPLITEAAAQRIEAQIARAVAEGAQLLIGGTREGNFIAPAVLTSVPHAASVFEEEIFGPVLPVFAFDDFDEALRLANRSVYGLQAAIYTQDLGMIMRAFRELEVGTVVVNHTTAIRVENLPFGGTKRSGNGREGLHDTLLDMTEQKTLLMNNVFSAA